MWAKSKTEGKEGSSHVAIRGKRDPGSRNIKHKAFEAGTYLEGWNSSKVPNGLGIRKARANWGGRHSRSHEGRDHCVQTLDLILSEVGITAGFWAEVKLNKTWVLKALWLLCREGCKQEACLCRWWKWHWLCSDGTSKRWSDSRSVLKSLCNNIYLPHLPPTALSLQVPSRSRIWYC